MEQTKVILLGTGTPNIFTTRMGPSLIVQYMDFTLLFDAGVGVIRRAKEANINLNKLKNLFLSHLHSDHTIGLPDFMFTPSVSDRSGPIQIFGPQGTQNMVDSLLAAYKLDIQIRIEGLEKADPVNYKFLVNELTEGQKITMGPISVEPFPVIHGNWDSYGFRIITPDKIIVFSGDTKPCETMIQFAKGCDILIHEVYSEKQFHNKSPKWQEYHRNMHTSTKELAELASKIKPKKLILFHQLYWGETSEDLVKDIEEGYDGIVLDGYDLMEIE